jgi:hypothetical protein
MAAPAKRSIRQPQTREPFLKRSWMIVGGVATVAGILGVVLAYLDYEERHPAFDLTGDWLIEDTIQATNYQPFEGMKISFRISLVQQGAELTGTGEKWSQDGKWLPTSLHTPIRITKGTIKGGRIDASFEEQGPKRPTSGTFYWTYDSTAMRLVGTFSSSSGETHGNSVANRIAR